MNSITFNSLVFHRTNRITRFMNPLIIRSQAYGTVPSVTKRLISMQSNYGNFTKPYRSYNNQLPFTGIKYNNNILLSATRTNNTLLKNNTANDITLIRRQLATRSGTVYDATYTDSNSSSSQQQSYNPITGSMNTPETAGQALKRDVGMSNHMTKVYRTTFNGLLVWSSSIVAMSSIFSSFMLLHPIMTALMGFGLSIGSMFAMTYNQPVFRQLNNGSAISINSQKRIIYAGGVFAGLGITISPLIMLLMHVNPAAIPISIFSALGVMGGSYLYARTRPDGSLTTMGPALSGVLMGMIAVSLVNIFLHNPLLSNAMALLAIPVFAGFTAYDTHTAMADYREGRPDHLQHSVNFFLNFANLFQSFAQLSGIGNTATSAIGSGASTGGVGSGLDGLGSAVGAGASGLGDSGLGGMNDGMEFTSGMGDNLNSESTGGLFDGITAMFSSAWEFISGFFRD